MFRHIALESTRSRGRGTSRGWGKRLAAALGDAPAEEELIRGGPGAGACLREALRKARR